jgi:hypothetical protein
LLWKMKIPALRKPTAYPFTKGPKLIGFFEVI